MGFPQAFELVKRLEGTGRPGESYGMTQETWWRLGMAGRVEGACEGDIAAAYFKLWQGCAIEDPEVGGTRSVFEILGCPADAVGFQCFINLPWNAFHRLLQEAAGAEPDGAFGPQTYWAITAVKPPALAAEVLRLQEAHYRAHAVPEMMEGLVNRVGRVKAWLIEVANRTETE